MNKVDHDKGQKDEKLQNLEEDDDDDNEDDAFSDALETLSSTESLCAQDFMMNRFLPAAKDMTLQPHQHAPRKQSVMLHQPSTKLVNDDL
ncbi:DUF688 family protein [Medicago truncatula]|nr:DUF688 family protein [Medicago truncatula]